MERKEGTDAERRNLRGRGRRRAVTLLRLHCGLQGDKECFNKEMKECCAGWSRVEASYRPAHP